MLLTTSPSSIEVRIHNLELRILMHIFRQGETIKGEDGQQKGIAN